MIIPNGESDKTFCNPFDVESASIDLMVGHVLPSARPGSIVENAKKTTIFILLCSAHQNKRKRGGEKT